MRFTYPQPLLSAAIRLSRLGISVLPLRPGTKVPAVKWKKYQYERADEETLRQWFQDTDTGQLGIGVVLGAVSGGLLCRDFDEQAAYDAWKRSHALLARILPTVMAARGPHVWFRCEGYKHPDALSFIRNFDDGELRGDAHIAVVPPSIHGKTGQPYRWLIEPTDQIPLIDLVTFGFRSGGHVTQAISVLHPLPPASSSSPTSQPAAANLCVTPSASFLTSGTSGDRQPLTVEVAIERTLPTREGERHHRIFDFARYLKAIPDVAALDLANLDPLVRQWHARALPHIGTKDYETTKDDFMNAWVRIRIPAGCGSLAAAWERAVTSSLPAEAMQFDEPKMRLLVSICRELQRETGDTPFFLSCRDAAAALGLTGKKPHVRASRWLKALCHAGILRPGAIGSLKDRKASEFWYVGAGVAPIWRPKSSIEAEVVPVNGNDQSTVELVHAVARRRLEIARQFP